MSTQMFLRDAAADWATGKNDQKLNGSISGWVNKLLSTSRGAAATSKATNTVAGTTNGVEVTDTGGGNPIAWISPPLDADVTISGSITWNLRAAESSMSANVAINGVLEKIDGATGAITTIDQTARTTELALTTEGANNFAETPAAGVACKRGDRLRVRIFGDDAGTMGSGFTFTFWYDGPTDAASGDSYLTLTENLTFVSEPAGTTVYPTNTGIINAGGDTGYVTGGTVTSSGAGTAWAGTGNVAASDDAYATVTTDTGSQALKIQNLGLSIPAGNFIVGVEVELECKVSSVVVVPVLTLQLLDAAGSPVGSLKSATLSTTEGTQVLGSPSDVWGATLTEAIVEDVDFGVQLVASTDITAATFSIDRVRVKVYYDVLNAIAREAWTSRGAGVQNDVTNTSAGFTTPKQATDSAGGRVVEWYTKPLAAFTLGGAVRCNIRALESAAGVNAAARVEIAVCNGDGSSPVDWGVTTFASELGTSEAAQSFLVSGDDTSVSDGQRIRIRVLFDDSQEAAMTSGTTTLYYAGTSGGASGDTFLTFTQTLTEFSSNPTPAAIALAAGFPAPRIDQQVAHSAALALTAGRPAPSIVFTVNPAALALTLAAVAPTRMDQNLSPAALARSLSPVAPRIDQAIAIAAAIALTIAEPAPSRMDQTLSPAAAARSLIPVAPRVDQQLVMAAIALVTGEPAPRVDQSVSPAALARALGILAPSRVDQTVPLNAIALAIAAVAPRVDQSVSPAALALATAELAPRIDQALEVAALALALSAVAPSSIDVAGGGGGQTVTVDNPVALATSPVAPSRVDQTLDLVALAIAIAELAPTQISFPQTVSPAALAQALTIAAPQVNQSVAPAALARSLGILSPTAMHFALDLINIALTLGRPNPTIEGGAGAIPPAGADPWFRRQQAPTGSPIEAWSLYTSLIARYGLAEGRTIYERMLHERKGPFQAGAKYDPDRGTRNAVPHVEIPKARRN